MVAPTRNPSEPWANGGPAAPPAGQSLPADGGVPRATAADVRGVRRWALFAAAGALVATALAVAALLDSSERTEGTERDRGTEATQIRRALDERLNAGVTSLRADLDEKATARELQELDKRLQELRKTSSRASARASSRASRTSSELEAVAISLDEIEQRLAALEQAPQQQPEAQAGDGGAAVP